MIGVGSVGGIWLAIEQFRISVNENLKLEKQLTDLQSERNNLKADLEKRDSRIHEQTQNIVLLNEKLVEKSDYISNYLTGGKGFPVISISPIKLIELSRNERATFVLHNDNTLPLYDITAIVMDWDYILSKQTKSDDPIKPYLKEEDLKKSIIYRIDEPHMFQNTSIRREGKFEISEGMLYIELKSKSSLAIEWLAFVIENKAVYHGFSIRDIEGKILKEWISPGTPPSAEGAIKKKFELVPSTVAFTLTE